METTSAPISAPPDAAASRHVFQVALGYIASTALYAAVKLRVADHLACGPLSIDDLARATGSPSTGAVNADALYRVLRMLASVGIFEETSPRHFANNAASNTIRTGIPDSLYDMGLWITDPFHLRVYADAMHSVTTGQPAVEKTTGVPVFDFFRTNPELSEIFNNAMTGFSTSVIAAALEVYDFSGIGTLVDVAGGHGQVLGSILQRYPAMRGVLFDLDHVIAGAVPRLRQLGVEGRVMPATGDFFKAVPAGGDAYIMKHIFHDWDDDRAITILRNIRSAMNQGGRVILLESVLLPGNAPDFGKLIDLEMLMMTGGRERTEAEFRTLFQRAGFELTRVVPTPSPLSVIEAR
ncbi:MAG: acetylserotonin O-methyltransferase [Acidobacteria bacterium]|nr:acetylserotonin O-methyltransferase [Acidobacteriota bacterium]MCA1649752.1 acetylserotonin O-methyltransferase [Acidobacteriota bacterium]